MTDLAQIVQLLHQIVDLLAAIFTLLQSETAQGKSDFTTAVKAAGDAAITYKLLFPH
jgi:hypothetical protein